MFMSRAALSLGVCCCTSAVEMSRLGFSSTGGTTCREPKLRGKILLYIIYWLLDGETKLNLDAQDARLPNDSGYVSV